MRLARLGILLTVGIGVAGGARAAPAMPAPGADIEGEGRATAMVTLDGVPLVRVVGLSSLSPQERADRIAGRIEALAADRTFDVALLEVREGEFGHELRAGERRVMVVTGADAAVEGLPTAVLAAAYRDAIRDAIATWREARTPQQLLRSVAASVAALLALAVAILLVVLVARRADGLLERRLGARIRAVEFKSFKVLDAERIRKLVRAGVRAVRTLAIAACAFVTMAFVLSRFPWTRPTAERLLSYLLDPLGAMALAFVRAVPSLLFLAVLAVVVRWALKLTRLFFTSVETGSVQLAGFEREWAWPTYRILRFAMLAFALVVAYPYIPGSGTEAFKGISILAGVVFSLGSSSAVSSMIAGYAMTYRRAFRVGDRVKIGNVVGDVQEVRVTVTRLRTLKNEEVVISNSLILAGEVTNYSAFARDGGLILHTTVGIGYETPWRQVEAMLLLAADRTPGLLASPPPFVLQTALGDFCVTYELNVHCGEPREMLQRYTALHRSVLDVFNEYGVQIMTPAYERDPEVPKVVARDKWYEAPAAPPAIAAAAPAADVRPPASATAKTAAT